MRLLRMRFAVCAVCAICGAGHCVEPGPWHGAVSLDAKLVPNVAVAPLSSLRNDPQAEKGLGCILRHHPGTDMTDVELWQAISAMREELDDLRLFAEKHEGTKAALAARFLGLAAIMFNPSNDLYVEVCRGGFEEIVKANPATPEAAVARALLKALAVWEGEDERTRARRMRQRIEAFEAALPAAREIDERSRPLSPELRGKILGPGPDRLHVRLLFSNATAYEYLGEYDNAGKVYDQIIQEYPTTPWAQFAENDKKDITLYEKTGQRPLIVLRGLHKGKRR